ncbi:MAG: hypothetical protein R2786_09160 [Flavobacteriaceae bacterium]
MSLKKIFLLSFIVVATSCSKHTLDDVMEPVQETPELVTFQDVKFVFDNVCQQCHINPPLNGAPMPLISFENVKEAVLNRNLLSRISANEGDPFLMPFGGPRLPQSSIDLIFQWEEDGLLEN